MATAVDAIIMTTIKQHGFVVREGPKDYAPPQEPAHTVESTSTLEEGINSGLNRKALGLDSHSRAVQSLPSGLPRSGDLRPAEHAHLSSGVKRLMRSVMRGLKAHQEPEAAVEGLGGTYFFRNEAGNKIAIMKPCDEEPLAPNNPKGFVGRQLGEPGLKPTVRVGEAATREVAAYLLDHEHFARVPHTVMVHMTHPIFHRAASTNMEILDPMDSELGLPPKNGSLQEFVPHECDTSELGASCFSVRDVQRIGIIDIRLFNTDRHGGNILVRRSKPHTSTSMIGMDAASALADLYLKDQYELIPIDHGFALPEALEPPYFEWQHWPQAMMPFGKEELDYIARLDPVADVEMLRRELPTLREESLRLLQVSTTVLKKCAAAGMTLAEIANVVTRPLIGLDDDPSELEKICFAAREEVDALAADDDTSSEYSEDEDQVEDEDLLIPSSDSEGTGSEADRSTATDFAPRPHSSDASRMTDDMVLFSMDEDGGAARTPLNGSPTRLGGSLGGASAKDLLTPTRGGMLGAYYGSHLGNGTDSMPGSYDSADAGPNSVLPGDNHNNSMMSTSTFGGGSAAFQRLPATFGAGHLMAGAGAIKTQPRPSSKGRRGRREPGRSRLRKMVARAYPPLVESRGQGATAAVFHDLTETEWEFFMASVKSKIDAAIASGCWELPENNRPAPLMSCPKF